MMEIKIHANLIANKAGNVLENRVKMSHDSMSKMTQTEKYFMLNFFDLEGQNRKEK